MHKLAKIDKENVKIVVSGCPCVKVSRKSDRPALANIQGDTTRNYQLSAEQDSKKSVHLQVHCNAQCSKPSSHSKLNPPSQISEPLKFRSKSTSSASKTCCKVTTKVQLSTHIPIKRGAASTVKKALFQSASSESSGYVSNYSKETTPHILDEAATLPDPSFVTLTHETCLSVAASFVRNTVTSKQHLNERNINVKRASPFDCDQDTQFVNAADYFKELNKEKPEEEAATRKTAFSRDLKPKVANSGRIPAVKSTLRTQHSQRKIKFPLLYTPDYIENIIDYSYGINDKLRLRKEWIQTKIDTEARALTLNWLMTAYPLKNFPESVYFTAVRVFDYSVLGLTLKIKTYRLAAIVCLWLAEKYHGPGILVASKIALLFNGDYCKTAVLRMERDILRLIDFCFKMADPLDFLYYYLVRAKRDNDELLKFASKFVLECASLSGMYCILESSFLAAAAIFLAYHVVYGTRLVHFDFRWHGLGDVEYFVQKQLKATVSCAVAHKYEPYYKYSDSKRMGVALMFKSF